MHVKRIMEKYWNQTFKVEYSTRYSTMNVCVDKKERTKREKTNKQGQAPQLLNERHTTSF